MTKSPSPAEIVHNTLLDKPVEIFYCGNDAEYGQSKTIHTKGEFIEHIGTSGSPWCSVLKEPGYTQPILTKDQPQPPPISAFPQPVRKTR
jgi:hypothetical protein